MLAAAAQLGSDGITYGCRLNSLVLCVLGSQAAQPAAAATPANPAYGTDSRPGEHVGSPRAPLWSGAGRHAEGLKQPCVSASVRVPAGVGCRGPAQPESLKPSSVARCLETSQATSCQRPLRSQPVVLGVNVLHLEA